MNLKLVTLALFSISLTGCFGQNDKYADLQEIMRKADTQAGPPLEEIPQAQSFEEFDYQAHDKRSPFDQPKTFEAIVRKQASSNIKPDFLRAKEVLENFPLDALTLKGTMARAEVGGVTALVAASDGNIYQVFKGQYVGKNHGKIMQVSDQRIDIVEIISDNQGGWLERPATIELKN